MPFAEWDSNRAVAPTEYVCRALILRAAGFTYVSGLNSDTPTGYSVPKEIVFRTAPDRPTSQRVSTRRVPRDSAPAFVPRSDRLARSWSEVTRHRRPHFGSLPQRRLTDPTKTRQALRRSRRRESDATPTDERTALPTCWPRLRASRRTPSGSAHGRSRPHR